MEGQDDMKSERRVSQLQVAGTYEAAGVWADF
jgi:hypothetical protein